MRVCRAVDITVIHINPEYNDSIFRTKIISSALHSYPIHPHLDVLLQNVLSEKPKTCGKRSLHVTPATP